MWATSISENYFTFLQCSTHFPDALSSIFCTLLISTEQKVCMGCEQFYGNTAHQLQDVRMKNKWNWVGYMFSKFKLLATCVSKSCHSQHSTCSVCCGFMRWSLCTCEDSEWHLKGTTVKDPICMWYKLMWLQNNKSQKNRQKQDAHLFTAIHQSDVLPSTGHATHNGTLTADATRNWMR